MRFAWWWMGAENGRMWASAPTGAMDGADLCARSATGFPRSPVGADALVSPRLPPGQRQRGTWQNARVAPAERGETEYPGPPGGFRQTSTRGQGVFRLPRVRRVAVEGCPVFVGTNSEQPPYLSQLARKRKFGARRFFLLDRPRPVFFLSRTKRKWGVESRGDRHMPRPIGRTPQKIFPNL